MRCVKLSMRFSGPRSSRALGQHLLVGVELLPWPAVLTYRLGCAEHPQLEQLRLRQSGFGRLTPEALAVLSGDAELNSDPLRLVAGSCCGGHGTESRGANKFRRLDTPKDEYFYLSRIDG